MKFSLQQDHFEIFVFDCSIRPVDLLLIVGIHNCLQSRLSSHSLSVFTVYKLNTSANSINYLATLNCVSFVKQPKLFEANSRTPKSINDRFSLLTSNRPPN